MQSTKSVTIVLVALILTGLCGYVLNAETHTVSKTTYDYKGDLTPSVNYTQIDDWIEYNPMSNITGWDRNTVSYVISDTATPYLIDPSIIEYTTETATNPTSLTHFMPLSTYSDIEYTDGMVIHTDKNAFYQQSNWNVGTKNSTSMRAIFTGSGDTKVFVHDFVYQQNTNSVYPAEKVTDSSGNEIWQPIEGSMGYYVTDKQIYSFYVSPDIKQTTTSWSGTDPYADASSGATVVNITYETPVRTAAAYTSATDFVTIADGTTGTWTNGQVNGTVTLLMSANGTIMLDDSYTLKCPQNVPYDYFLVTLDFINGSFTCKGVTSLSNTLSYTVADYDYNMTITHVESQLGDTARADYYSDRIVITSNDKTWEIPTTTASYSFYGDTTDWTVYNHTNSYLVLFMPVRTTSGSIIYKADVVSGYGSIDMGVGMGIYFGKEYSIKEVENKVELTTEGTPDVPGIETTVTTVDLTSISGLSISASDGDVSAYVVSTVVQVDPSGILWGDPVMPLQYYFPDQMEGNSRVLFNGFVKYGSSLTINGQKFAISDGKLLYENESGDIERYTLKGMAIDFIHESGKTYVNLVFTEQSNKTISLGELNSATKGVKIGDATVQVVIGYTVWGTGNWYWQSGVYDIHITSKEEVGLSLVGNFALNLSGVCLLMVFFILIAAAVMIYVMKTEFEGLDWVILGATVLLLLTVALVM